MTKTLPGGTVHALSKDMRDALLSDAHLQSIWRDITPLARNEWICWVTSAKKDETRAGRIGRMRENLTAGKRRPCCWPGCPHRKGI